MNIAVILAGGSGSRLGGALPKQFLKVAGKKIIEHTIFAFENNENIDEIAVVTKEEFVNEVEQLVVSNLFKKVKKVLVGGKERYHSSLSAINAYTDDSVNLIFHDAVRPLVNDRIIDDCVKALENYNAIDVAIKATDTIIRVDDSDCICEIPPRAELRNGQTPQCFKRGTIRRAYEIALQDPNFVTTDDCGVVRKYLPEEKVFVVPGEVFNMKVTYTEDLFLLDKLYQLKSIKGNNHELVADAGEKMAGKVMVVFGGSYGIGEEVVKIGRELGATVYSFSRSENGVDVTDAQKVREVLAEVKAQNGRIDYVVNTAGILVKEPLYGMDYETIVKSVNVNYLGVVNVAKESFEYLRESKGSMLFYTSSSYTKGRMMYSIYSSTKAAIVNLVQALSEEWAEFGIRVNCVNPERTKTPMRVQAFGNEPDDTLLNPKFVGIATVNTLISKMTGEVIDVRR
ncbi:MAG: bifunctional cytidylyltransferase/SDR family oxidoreductase [Prevotellaceae bacterium]|nr:bifunctional cytidylyltransferase/SDR family oxidoreductase [Prevotellaceae bacterium]